MPRSLPKNNYQDLERLYQDRAGGQTLGNLQRPSRSPWRRLTMILFFFLALGSLAAWSGFYVFNSFNQNRKTDVRLEIVAPESVPVADPVEYRLRLTNVSAVAVSDLSLRVNYPEGFIWKNATRTPESSGHNTWSLGTLAAGEGKEVVVQGMLLGEAGGIRTIFGVANYRLPNFRSELEATASAGTKLENARLRLTWSGPTSSVPGETVRYELNYMNEGTSELPASTLSLALSPNFKVSETSPTPAAGAEYQWDLSPLLPRGSGVISISGSWAEGSVGEETMAARVETKSDTGARLPITSSSLAIRLSRGDVLLSLSVNGSATPPAVNAGEMLEYALEYENTSDHTIGDATIRVRYDADLIDWSGVTIEDKGRVEGSTIIWASAEVPALVKILPRGRGVLRWKVPVIAAVSETASSLDIVSTPSLVLQRLDGEIVDRTFEGAALTVSVNGPVAFTVEARYFDEASRPIGGGPLPPKVGATTTYQITWRIRDTRRELKDIRVSAELPPEVRLADRTTAAETGAWLRSEDGLPEWRIDRLAASLEPSVSFLVELTPTDADEGKVLALTGRTILVATDNVTQGRLEAIGNVVTTSLEADTVARGQGVVVR